MDKATRNVKCEMLFENKPDDKSATANAIEILVNKSMDAWHKSIEDYSCHSNEYCRIPYIHNERTTSGLFATAIAKHAPLPGVVLMELPANKKNVKTGVGRTDIVWIDQNNTVGINFELKQKRVNIEEKDKNGVLKSKDIILEEIKDAFFDKQKGLVAQSVRDFDKYQGAKRLVNKSRDGHYHVGLLFCPVMINKSIANKDIKDEGIFNQLRSKILCWVLDENGAETYKGKPSKLSNKDFSRSYSSVHLYRSHEQDSYSLITVAIVFRSPKVN